MRSWNRADRLAVILVVLAGANVGVLDQVGHGLVSDVEAKYTSLGADWIVLRYTYTASASLFDREAVLADLERQPGVRDVMWAVVSDQVVDRPGPSTSTGSFGFVQFRSQEFLLLGPDYDPAAHPFLYALFTDQSEKTSFYRSELIWTAGRAPSAPSEIALPQPYALEQGIAVGDSFVVPWDRGFSANQAAQNRTFHVVGLFDPIPTGNPGEDTVRFLVAPSPELLEATSKPGMLPNRLLVFVKADLARLGDVAARTASVLEAHGLTMAVQEATARVLGPGGGTFGTVVFTTDDGAFRSSGGNGTANGSDPDRTSPDPSPTNSGPTPSTTPDPTPDRTVSVTQGDASPWDVPSVSFPVIADVDMFGNAELLDAAFDAAGRAGLWFRFLSVGSVVLAGVGIAFIVRANSRRMIFDVGIRQAAGFTASAIVLHWLVHAAFVTLVGSGIALLVVTIPTYLGLGPWLLGVPLVIGASTWVLIPIMALTLYLLAGGPLLARLVRRPPAVNLREVDPR